MGVRYCVRENRTAHEVFDAWTGEVVVIALVPQDDLDIASAQDLAAMLNRRASQGDRTLRQ